MLLCRATSPGSAAQLGHHKIKQLSDDGVSGGPGHMWVSRPPTHVLTVACDPPLQAILRDFTVLTLYGMVLLQLYGKRALRTPYWRPDPGPEPLQDRSALQAGRTRATAAQGPVPRAWRT